jgi:hypothetical protein
MRMAIEYSVGAILVLAALFSSMRDDRKMLESL